MSQNQDYLNANERPVVAILNGIDRDVARGEDILMYGFLVVLLAPAFAPIAPPHILLPLMAAMFALSSCLARWHFYTMQRRLAISMRVLETYELSQLQPITDIFSQYPQATLTESFNPLKNIKRTLKSVLGGMLINPLWMPIFYMLGIQFAEEKQLGSLNNAVVSVQRKIFPSP